MKRGIFFPMAGEKWFVERLNEMGILSIFFNTIKNKIKSDGQSLSQIYVKCAVHNQPPS